MSKSSWLSPYQKKALLTHIKVAQFIACYEPDPSEEGEQYIESSSGMAEQIVYCVIGYKLLVAIYRNRISLQRQGINRSIITILSLPKNTFNVHKIGKRMLSFVSNPESYCNTHWR